MKRGAYIIGTDTDIGKTFVSAVILKSLKNKGINATYFKPVLSGCEKRDGEIIPKDCEIVCDIANLKKDYKKMVPYSLINPYSPHLASEIEEVNIDISKIINHYKILEREHDFILTEGCGGIICPIYFGEKEIMQIDIIKKINSPIFLVISSDIGTINHTMLTIKYLEQIGFYLDGIIFNRFDTKNIIHRDNLKTIKKLSNINNILTIKEDKDLKGLDLDKIYEFIKGASTKY